MSVKVRVPSLLQLKLTGGQETFEVAAHTPLECLRALESQFPKMRKWLYDEHGDVRPQVWVFVNGEKVHPDELTRTLGDDDEVAFLFAISGG
jgi:molybdopterin converting factor small subunit